MKRLTPLAFLFVVLGPARARAVPLAMALLLPLLALAPIARAADPEGGICPDGRPVTATAIALELMTGPEVLNHLPGPTAGDFGDRRIGTSDDGVHPGLTVPPAPGFQSLFGFPNDLAGESCAISICGVAGSPRTRLLHGTSFVDSEESSLHAPESNELSLAETGRGAYSFVLATVGQFETLSYLAGGLVFALTGFQSFSAEMHMVNLTIAGTALFPGTFFSGPFDLDLVTVGPGADRVWGGPSPDETGETIVQGCNGLAPGVDDVDRWFPVSPAPYPKFPDLRRANAGTWGLFSSPEEGGRRLRTRIDALAKVPTAAGFFVLQELPLDGYLFPTAEAQALVNPGFPRDTGDPADLPDVPGFPGSGRGLARYFVDVLVPKAADDPAAVLVGLLRGSTEIEIIGIDTLLDFTLVGTGQFIEYDLCTLDVRPCTF